MAFTVVVTLFAIWVLLAAIILIAVSVRSSQISRLEEDSPAPSSFVEPTYPDEAVADEPSTPDTPKSDEPPSAPES